MPTVQQLYDRWHADRFARYDEITPGAPWHLMARKHIPEGSLRGKTVFEAGCGFGQFALWLAEQGGDVTAGDLSGDTAKSGHRVLARSPVVPAREPRRSVATPLVAATGTRN